ncbi:hypothetical protein ACFW04_013747 [Cataglyphis niger]
MNAELNIELPLMSSPIKKNKRGQLIHSSQKLIIINLQKIKKNNPKILSKLHKFYFNRKFSTLNKILQAVKPDKDLPNFKLSTFHSLLKKLNFTYITRHCNSILTEREDLITWRKNYLRTWINASDVRNKVWMNKTVKSKKDVFLRGLTTGTANAAGFVSGGFLCFKSKKHTSDYYDEMNGNSFHEWLKNILPLLEDNAVIIMDNTPKGKEVSEIMVKAELLQIVSLPKSEFDKYVTNNDTFKIQDIKLLLEQDIRVTAEHWNNFRHVKDEEKKIWKIDHIADSIVDKISPLIINVTGEDVTDSKTSDN